MARVEASVSFGAKGTGMPAFLKSSIRELTSASNVGDAWSGRVYWNIRWGLYNSMAAPVEALGCIERPRASGKEGSVSLRRISNDASGQESMTLLDARSRCGSRVDHCQAAR